MTSTLSETRVDFREDNRIVSFFARRKASFIESLKHVLASVISDGFIKQMFEDKSSAMYIPDRVVELIRRYLNDDREECLHELYRTVAAIEAYFGPETARELIETGEKIVDFVANSDKPVDAEYIERIKNNARITVLTSGNAVDKRALLMVKRYLKVIRGYIEHTRKIVLRMVKLMRNGLAFARTKSEEMMMSAVSQIKDQKQMEGKFRKELADTRERAGKFDIPRLKNYYEEQLAARAATEESLNRQLEKSKKAMAALTKKHQKVVNELSETKARLTEVQESIPDLGKLKSKYEEEMEEMRSEMRGDKMQISELMSSSRVQQGESQLHESLLAAKAKIKEKNLKIAELQRLILKERQEKEAILSARSTMEVDMQMATTKLGSLEALQKEKDEAINKCKLLKSANVELKSQLKELKRSWEKSKRDAEQLRVDISEMEKSQKIQTDASRELRQLKDQVSALNIDVANKSTRLDQLRQENENLKKKLKDQTASLKERKKDLDDAKSKSEEMTSGFKTRVSNLNEKCDEYASSLQLHKQKLHQSTREIATLTKQVKELEEQNQDLQNRLSRAIQEASDAKMTQSQTSEALMYAQENLKRKEKIIQQLGQSEQMITQQKNDFQLDVEKASEEISKQKNDLREGALKIQTLEHEIKDKDAEISELKAQIQALTEKVQSHRDKRRSLQASIDSLRREAKSHILNSESTQEINEDLRLKLASLRNEITLERNSREAAERAKEKANDDLARLQMQVDEDKKRHKEDLSKLQHELTQVQDAKNELEHQLDKATFDNKTRAQEFARKEEEMQFEDEKKQQDIDILQTRSDEQTKRILKLEDELGDASSKIRSLKIALPQVSSVEEIPALVDEYRRQTQEQNEILTRVKQLVGGDVVAGVYSLKKAHDEMKQREKQLLDTLPNTKVEDLAKDVESMRQEIEGNKQQEKALIEILGEKSIVSTTRELKRAHQAALEREEEIKKLFDGYSYDSVPRRIAAIMDEARELRDRERTVLGIVGEAKPENLAKVVTEMKLRLGAYDKMAEGLRAVFPGTDVSKLVDVVKQVQQEKEQLDEEKNKILAFKGGSLSKAVDSLIQESQELKMIARMVPKTGETISDSVANLIKENTNFERRQRELQNCANTDDVMGAVSEFMRTNRTLDKLLPGEGSLIDRVAALSRANEKLEKERKKLAMELPEGSDSDDIFARMKKTMTTYNDMKLEQDKISGILGEFHGSNIERVNELIRLKNSIEDQQQRIAEMIPLEAKGHNVIERVQAWSQLYAQLTKDNRKMAAFLPTNFKGSLCDGVENLAKERKNLLEERDRLSDLLHSTDLVSTVTSLLNSKRQLDDVRHILNTNDGEDIRKKAGELVEKNQLLQRVSAALGCSQSGNIEEYAASLQRQLHNAADALKLDPGTDISKRISQLQSGLESASRLIARILSLLSNSTVSVDIPMEPQQEKQLLSMIEAFRQKSEAALTAADEIINRGRGVGYNGNNLMESVDTIVQVAVGEEKQRGIERMHEELTSLRAMHEKERSTLDQQKAKLKRKLADQRAIVADLQEKTAQKEEEFLLEIEKEQKTTRAAQNECQREKRIHDELMRVINGKATDNDFLKCYMEEGEITAIKKAEKILQEQRA